MGLCTGRIFNMFKFKHYKLHLILALLACTLGSPFQIGFNSAVLNTPAKVIKQFYNETYHSRNGESMSDSSLTILWAVTVSSYCLGAMIGCTVIPNFTTRFGRKQILLCNNFLALLAAAMQATSKSAGSYELLIAGRTVAGIMCGVISVIAPGYVSEIAPIALRGFCGAATPVALVCGLVVGSFIGSENLLGTEDLWPVILACGAIPAIYSMSTLSWCPESPQYLMLTRGDEDGAVQALQWLRHTNDVKSEIEIMKKEKEEMQKTEKFSIFDLFRLPKFRTPLAISVVLQICLQLTGINAIAFYSTSIFEMANLSTESSQIATVGTALLNLLLTLVSALIVDRAGRRTLLLGGLVGMLISTVVLVVCLVYQSHAEWLAYISVTCVYIFIVFFAVGPGSIPWIMVAELFEQGPRTTALGTAVVFNWFCTFLVGLCYPLIEDAIHLYSFLPFSFIIAGCLMFSFIYVPETKGKTILEITSMFDKSHQKPESNVYVVRVEINK